jgi:hypothetical protein
MEVTTLSKLEIGQKFKKTYQKGQEQNMRIFEVQHKLISQTGGIGCIDQTDGSQSGVYHPDTKVIPL